MQAVELVRAALEVRARAYAPYSGFPVGAALLGNSGRVYTGCNVENASYGLTLCAERAALARGVADGEREFSKIAIAGGGAVPCLPCGACLQVLAEFAPDLEVITANAEGQLRSFSLKDLLPFQFKL